MVTGALGCPGQAGGVPGCPATGVGHVQELQQGDVGESCLSDLREGHVHHRPANETKLQGYAGEERAAEGLCHPLPLSTGSTGTQCVPVPPQGAGQGTAHGTAAPQQPRSAPQQHLGLAATPHVPTPCGSLWLSVCGCTHTDTQTRGHTLASSMLVCLYKALGTHCISRDLAAVSPWGSGPQGHVSRTDCSHAPSLADRWLMCEETCHHHRTRGPEPGYPQPPPSPLRPPRCPYPALPRRCPQRSTKRAAVPPIPGQPGDPTSPAPPWNVSCPLSP